MKFRIGQEVQIKKISDIRNRGALVYEIQRFCGTLGNIYDVSFALDSSTVIYQIEGWSWREEWIELQEFLTDEDFDF